MCISHRFNDLAGKLSQEQRDVLAKWFRSVRKHSGGRDVAMNFASDIGTDERLLRSFMSLLINRFRELSTGNDDIMASKQAYLDASKLLADENETAYFQGRKSEVPHQLTLHKVLRLEALQAVIARSFLESSSIPEENQECWNTYLDWYETEQLDKCRELLNNVVPCNKRVNWAYFNSERINDDPLYGESASASLDKLGLPKEWYPRELNKEDIDSTWKIHYTCDTNVARHVPTIFDTFPCWNPYFQVTRDKLWGWTRPIGSKRGTHGLPEVVHRSWTTNEYSDSIVAFPEYVE